MSTPNLAIPHIAAAQNQKEATANTAFDDLDLALTNGVVEAMGTTPAFTLPTNDYLYDMVFHFTGSLHTIGIVTIPASKKIFIISNQANQPLLFQTPVAGGRTVLVNDSGSFSIPIYAYSILYCDGVNVDLIAQTPSANLGYEHLRIFMSGAGVNNQVLMFFKNERSITFPAGAYSSTAVAKVAATGSTVFTFKKNGVGFATVTFAAGSTVGVFNQANDAVFDIQDLFEVDGPATADATLANMGIVLQGFRL